MIRIATALLASAILLWGSFTLFVLSGDNFRKVLPDYVVKPGKADWQMIVGTGEARADGWAILHPGPRGQSRVGVGLPWPAAAESIERVEVVFEGDVPHRPMHFAWSPGAASLSGSLVSLEPMAASTAAVEASRLRPDAGHVSFLVFEVFGDTEPPIVIESIRLAVAKPGFLQLQRRLFVEWFAFPPWTQKSANHTRASLEPLIVSPVLAVALWGALALLLALVLCRFAFRLPILILLTVAVLGWLLLDIRWQADLFSKSATTIRTFSGKSWQERRAADIDGRLHEFIVSLKGIVDERKRRVFALGRDEFWRTRARYHGLPWSIRSTGLPLNVAWTRHLRTGDMVLLLDAPHIELVEPAFPDGPGEEFSRSLDLSGSSGYGETLIRDQDLELPAAGFYRVVLRLRGNGPGASVRAVVNLREEVGGRVTALYRHIDLASDRFETASFLFVAPENHDARLSLVQESGERLRAEFVRVDRVAQEGLVWLRSDERGPFVVVRPLLVDPLNGAYEVL